MPSYAYGEAAVLLLEAVYGYDTRADSLAFRGETAGA
jgi:hypothetical protein